MLFFIIEPCNEGKRHSFQQKMDNNKKCFLSTKSTYMKGSCDAVENSTL